MGKFVAGLILAVTLVAGGLSSSARAEGKQDFTLVNKTGYQIEKVFVSPTKSDDWQDDILGRGTLDDGEKVDITFHRAATGCKWDLKVVYTDDGSSAVWQALDLCTISKVTIRYDRKSDTTSASVE